MMVQSGLSFEQVWRRRGMRPWVVIGAAIACGTCTAPVPAAVVRLSNNSFEERSLHVRLGQAVWQGRNQENGTYEIYYWPGIGGSEEVVRVTNNLYDDISPQAGQAGIVWYAGNGPGGTDEIWFWEGGPAGAASSPQQLTTNAVDDQRPVTDGDLVAWQAQTGTGGTWEIYVHDLHSAVTQRLTNNAYHDLSPVTDGRFIAWMSRSGTGARHQIFIWDSTTGVTSNLSNNSLENRSPVLRNGWVAWEAGGGDDSTFEIVLWKGQGAPQTLTSNSYFDGEVALGGKRVAWTAENTIDGTPNIMIWEDGRGLIYQSTTAYSDFGPAVTPSQAGWVTLNGTPQGGFATTEIARWNGTTVERLTNNGYADRGAVADFEVLGWLSEVGPNATSDVYVYVTQTAQPPFDVTIVGTQLAWPAVPAHLYRVEARADMGSATPWSTVDFVRAGSDTATYDLTAYFAAHGRGFFRVVDISL